MSKKYTPIIDEEEIDELIRKGIIKPVHLPKVHNISNIITTLKSSAQNFTTLNNTLQHFIKFFKFSQHFYKTLQILTTLCTN